MGSTFRSRFFDGGLKIGLSYPLGHGERPSSSFRKVDDWQPLKCLLVNIPKVLRVQ
jgi:hypothetical protein